MRSFIYAFRGFASAFRSEYNLRVHIAAAILVIIVGFYFKLTTAEWGIITLCISAVVAMELMNTAIEKICNHVTATKHPAIKEIKDIAAAAVLVTAAGSLAVALLIFLPKLCILFTQ